MKRTSFPKKSKAGNENASLNKTQDIDRAIRISRANALLESTREQFEKNVLAVKRGLSPEGVGVLAGSCLSNRAKP